MQKLLSAAIVAVLFAGAADAAPKSHGPRMAHRNAARVAPHHGPAAISGLPVLYDQFTNASENGIFINDSSSSYDSYDEEGADDFVVPGPNGWTITQFAFQGFKQDMKGATADFATQVNITVSPDAAGVPAVAPTCSYSGVATNYDTNSTVVSVTLPTSCVLPPGHYWVQLQASNDPFSGGFFLWTTSSVLANSAALYQNPGDGEGTGCSTWAAITGCWGSPDPDFAFQVLGSVTTPVSLQSFDIE